MNAPTCLLVKQPILVRTNHNPKTHASLNQMSAKCYMRSTKEIKLSSASIN